MKKTIKKSNRELNEGEKIAKRELEKEDKGEAKPAPQNAGYDLKWNNKLIEVKGGREMIHGKPFIQLSKLQYDTSQKKENKNRYWVYCVDLKKKCICYKFNSATIRQFAEKKVVFQLNLNETLKSKSKPQFKKKAK